MSMNKISINKRLGYYIDFSTNTVYITRRFEEEANDVGSKAFKTLMALREKGFTFEAQKISRKKNKGLINVSYGFMETYIGIRDESAKYYAQYLEMRNLAKEKKNGYADVMKWFAATFPDYQDIPNFESKPFAVAPEKTPDTVTAPIEFAS